jgi:methylated-DNA-[protein]-cysteine S-methyltransferase
MTTTPATTAATSTFQVETPIGPLALTAGPDGLVAAAFGGGGARAARVPAALAPVADSVRAYFAGALDALDGVRLAPAGTTFQRAVWAALARIPAGRVASYGELASALGRPGAARAVGLACARNRLALFIPCHRAVGADGSLTGYAFGLERKAWLLAHEARGR